MINTQSFSLDEAEKGVLISFPQPTNLKVASQYILYFDAPVILPENAGTVVKFQPTNGSYAVIGSSAFVPKVLVNIKSLYRLQTKTLLRLIIKDTTNSIIYTDYLMLICSPESTTSVSAKLLVPTTGNTGPNGGSIIQLTQSNQSTSTITIGDRVQGPGIPVSETVYVKSIISSVSFELTKIVPITAEQSGTYTITKQIGCVDPSATLYTILDVTNNWTYKVRNQVIAKFVSDDPLSNQDLTIFLPIKNTALLAQEDSPAPIPSVSHIKAGGRVMDDTVPISDI
jgi:hypothetical protein